MHSSNERWNLDLGVMVMELIEIFMYSRLMEEE